MIDSSAQLSRGRFHGIAPITIRGFWYGLYVRAVTARKVIHSGPDELAQQLRQLRNIDRDPPRLVAREQFPPPPCAYSNLAQGLVMEYRGIRYTIRAGIERRQYRVAIYPSEVEVPANKIFLSREDAEAYARHMINRRLRRKTVNEGQK